MIFVLRNKNDQTKQYIRRKNTNPRHFSDSKFEDTGNFNMYSVYIKKYVIRVSIEYIIKSLWRLNFSVKKIRYCSRGRRSTTSNTHHDISKSVRNVSTVL